MKLEGCAAAVLQQDFGGRSGGFRWELTALMISSGWLEPCGTGVSLHVLLGGGKEREG